MSEGRWWTVCLAGLFLALLSTAPLEYCLLFKDTRVTPVVEGILFCLGGWSGLATAALGACRALSSPPPQPQPATRRSP
jgi:hypothetical protein